MADAQGWEVECWAGRAEGGAGEGQTGEQGAVWGPAAATTLPAEGTLQAGQSGEGGPEWSTLMLTVDWGLLDRCAARRVYGSPGLGGRCGL